MRNALKAALPVVLLALNLPLTAQQIQVNKDNRTIAVSTTDTATADADTATVHIGFQIYAADEQAAYASGSRTSNAIARALEAAGVKKDAIQSQSQNISHVQPYELQNLTPDQKAQHQFTVQQSWSVKTSAQAAASILDTAIKAGANQSGAIDWSVADADALESQAAGKALKRAQEIADRMAKGLGARLGTLLYASNQNPEAPRPIPLMRGMASSMAMKAETVEPLAISARKVTSSATVYAVFALE
ncbi:MAG TPA: SIMPL domain-containing protein [Acidisarcina sp.]|nr:SIMPL domain-containing protein [Acidisarcina sp.]